jgi:hypothetical protein
MLASARSCVPRGWNVLWGEVISLPGEILNKEGVSPGWVLGAEEEDGGHGMEKTVVVGWRGPVCKRCGVWLTRGDKSSGTGGFRPLGGQRAS